MRIIIWNICLMTVIMMVLTGCGTSEGGKDAESTAVVEQIDVEEVVQEKEETSQTETYDEEATSENSVTEDQSSETESLTTDEEIMNDADEDTTDEPLTVIEVEIPEDGVEVTDENRNKVALSRLMSVDSDEFQYLELNDYSDWESAGVRCIVELPDDNIRMYCYYDDEVWFSGVAFDIKGEICYFDWCYAGATYRPPVSIYWKEIDQQLQVICDPNHGTGFYAQDIYIVQKNNSGEWVSYHYGYDDYSKALEERIQLVFDDQKETVTIIDKKTGVELASQIDTRGVFSWTDVDCRAADCGRH